MFVAFVIFPVALAAYYGFYTWDRATLSANASAALADGLLTIELPPVSWTAAALS